MKVKVVNSPSEQLKTLDCLNQLSKVRNQHTYKTLLLLWEKLQLIRKKKTSI